ncbi:MULTISPECIES: recombinase family protein [Sphingobium]|uniref:recombinase family protein n=1 Tax=Sphingobium TaxID=165695 RepID=UPI00159C373A|nr:recombinase family protein [Sphingobium sp. 15-1]
MATRETDRPLLRLIDEGVRSAPLPSSYTAPRGTTRQDTAAQLDALRAAGCAAIFEDKASGASRERPQLARAIASRGGPYAAGGPDRSLGPFAEFERAKIRERTRAGLEAAVARGAKPGSPRMRARDAHAIADICYGHRERWRIAAAKAATSLIT